jgi:adhesin transport system outer membrane protein
MRRLFLVYIVSFTLIPKAMLYADNGSRESVAVARSWTLDRLIHETISGNPQVLSKKAAYLSAGEGVAAARWKFAPSPYLQLQRGSGDLLSSSYKQLEVYGVQQPIWTGGKLVSNLNVARAIERSNGLAVQETRLALAQEVVKVYQDLLGYHRRIRAHENGVRLMERYAALMERRVKAGVSAPIDQTQVNARLFQARNDLATSRSVYRVAMEQMTQLVGTQLKDGEIDFFTEAHMVEPPPADSLLAGAEGVSPVLARMEADIETAKYQRKLEKSALFPTVSLKAEHRNYRYANDSPAHENVVFASLEYTFGSGLSTLANVRSATERIESHVQAREAARRDLLAKIATDAEECSRAVMLYREASLTSKSAAEVLESYTRLFVAGKRSWLDVLNAARELTQSEVAEGDIVASYWGARYRLRLDAMDEALVGEAAPEK